MAKMNNQSVYALKPIPKNTDSFLINDSQDFDRTKTVYIQAILNLMNETAYLYSNGSDDSLTPYSKGYFFSNENNTDFTEVTSLILNSTTAADLLLEELYNYLIGNIDKFEIKLCNSNDPNNFAYFVINEITLGDDARYTFGVTVKSDLYLGQLINNGSYYFNFDLIQGNSVNQDNLVKPIYYQLEPRLLNAPKVSIASIVNSGPTFTVTETEIPLIVITQDVEVAIDVQVVEIKKFYFKLKGKGTYGTGGIQILESDIELTYYSKATADDIISLPSTQFIDVGEIVGNNIWDVVNLEAPFVIQEQSEGYRIFRTLIDGESINYLFLAPGGTYGFDELQTTEEDFEVFGNNVVNEVVDAGNRTVKLVTDEDPYFLIQSDDNKFLTITTEFDPVLSLGFTANTEFWIKNTSPTPREVLFDTDIEFIGSPLIPTNGLAILKLIEVVGGVEYWSVNHLLANGTPSGGGSFKKNIFFTTTLSDLGLTEFSELTNEIVKDWIETLEIVENDNEIYYFEVTDELSYNFDVTADWEGNEITNQSVFENYISATVSDFSLVEGRLRCNIQTSNEYIYLNNLGVTNINIFSYEGILELDLSDNNLLVFNPSKPLPDTLTKLFIDNNQIVDFNPDLQLPMLTELSLVGNLIVQFGFNNLPLTLLKLNLSGNLIEIFNLNLSGLTSLERVFLDGNNLSFLSPENVLPPSVWQFTIASNQIDSAGWVASESWASAQPLFDPGCGLETNLNIDTAFGTGFETILFTKNANITD